MTGGDGQGERRPEAAPGVVGVRLLGLLMAAAGFWQLAGNVLETWRDFDPSYAGYYFSSQLMRPLLGVGLGLLLWVFSRRIGGRIGRP